MRSSVISLCISNVSDVYENMAFWVCMCVCVFMCPRVGVDAPVAVGMLHVQHAWRGQRTISAHSSGVCPMLLETRSLTGQELDGRGRGQTSWPTSLLLPPLPS